MRRDRRTGRQKVGRKPTTVRDGTGIDTGNIGVEIWEIIGTSVSDAGWWRWACGVYRWGGTVLDSREWDARYGWNLVAEHGPQFDDYIAITTCGGHGRPGGGGAGRGF